jgi:peptide/nickel transport system ATP-binding protein
MKDAGPQQVLSCDQLVIASRIGGQRRTIVAGLSLGVGPGEAVGIVGESGSGKTLTALSLIGLLPAGITAEGRVDYRGRNLLDLPERELRRIRGASISMILQDPFTILNPTMRCERQIIESLPRTARRAMSRPEQRAEAARRLAEVGIADSRVLSSYPHELSGGMRQRVAIAAALAAGPDVLIADEPSTALDVTTQRDLLALLDSLRVSREMGLILITHDLRVAFSTCDRINVMYAGVIVESGSAADIEAEPLHPYTLGLLQSDPPMDRRLAVLPTISGRVPSPDEVAGQCPFMSRCAWAAPVCGTATPPLAPVTEGRESACVRIGEIRSEMLEAAQRIGDAAASQPRDGAGAVPLVRVDEVTKIFDGRSGKDSGVAALRDVSLSLREGESIGLVGESGSGKSTLGRCIVWLERPTTGEVHIDGIPIADFKKMSARDQRRLRTSVQMIFQDPYSSLNPRRTVGATLEEAIAARGSSANPRQEVRELLALTGLPESYAQRKPVALSGGERQRVAIARALAVKPKLIVCDEPVSALDVSVQAQILNVFNRLRSELGIGYLFITHDLAVVRQVVERILVLYQGQVVEQGDAADVLDHPAHWYTRKLISSIPQPNKTT